MVNMLHGVIMTLFVARVGVCWMPRVQTLYTLSWG